MYAGTPVIGELEITPRHLCGQRRKRIDAGRPLEEWTRACRFVTTDDDSFRRCSTVTRDVAGWRIFAPSSPIAPLSRRAHRVQ